MPRRLIIASIALTLLAFATGAAGATGAPTSHKVYVERDIVGQELAYRPHSIGLSADGTFALTGLRYSGYGSADALATGRAYVRGCTPNCAQGKVFRPTANVRLSDRIECRGLIIYARLNYTLQGPLPSGFRRQGSEPLRPVGEKGC